MDGPPRKTAGGRLFLEGTRARGKTGPCLWRAIGRSAIMTDKEQNMILRGSIVDPLQRRAFPGTIRVEGERIVSVEAEGPDAARPEDLPPPYILPGFVDAHVHIESSMLTPREFARVAVRQGTLAAMPDPHEIANVLGIDGVRYMMDMARDVPFTFGFGVPSCVPSTPFETAGGSLGPEEVADLLADPRVTHLSEVMNAPGVINRDPEMMAKLEAAKAVGKPIDGHAPLLSGDGLKAYAEAGISTDHECSNLEEAREKIALGFDILIRNGSAARDFDALLPILHEFPERCSFCADDKHPDEFLQHHINAMVAAAVADGVPLFDALRAASVNAVRHYKIDLGLLQAGDYADFIVLEDLVGFRPVQSWHHGRDLLADDFQKSAAIPLASCPNNFKATPVTVESFAWKMARSRVIGVTDGLLVTEALPAIETADWPAADDPGLLKLIVLNRYQAGAEPAVAPVKGLGAIRGAIASSVGHDSHNIIAAGSSDRAIAAAVNSIVGNRGGLSVTDENGRILAELPLPIAGLMMAGTAEEAGAAYLACNHAAKTIGTDLVAPFMTLSFLALPVIPHLKLTDLGLFDADHFRFEDE